MANPAGGPGLGWLAGKGLEPEGPMTTRARLSRVAQGWRLAQGLSRMATDHERPAKFSQGWQPTALRLTNSRSSSCALGVDPLAVRHMPEAIIVAEQGIEAGCDLGQPALCAG